MAQHLRSDSKGHSNSLTPLISIIIPVYNVESYIARCLDSCINQTLRDIEIIIVDDCGSDDSIQIAQDYAHKDPRIRIIHNEKNLGLFSTRIAGERVARGEYILPLDSDDYIDLRACEKAYNAIYQNLSQNDSQSLDTKPDIIFFGMEYDPRTFKRISPPVLCKPLFNDEILHQAFVRCIMPPWSIWAKLYKASHIRNVNEKIVVHMGENTHLTMTEDTLKFFWIAALAKKSIGIPDKLYYYCDSSSSITRKINTTARNKKIADIGRVIEEFTKLSQVESLKANSSFPIAQQRTINILKSMQTLEHRYDGLINSNGGGAYLTSCFKSLRYYRRWQTYVRILAYIFSLGFIKL